MSNAPCRTLERVACRQIQGRQFRGPKTTWPLRFVAQTLGPSICQVIVDLNLKLDYHWYWWIQGILKYDRYRPVHSSPTVMLSSSTNVNTAALILKIVHAKIYP